MSSPDPARYSGERRCHAHEPGIYRHGYIQNIINGEVNSFVARYRVTANRWYRWKPGCALTRTSIRVVWRGDGDHQQHYHAGDCMTGSALIREREHGTVEHLLVSR